MSEVGTSEGRGRRVWVGIAIMLMIVIEGEATSWVEAASCPLAQRPAP